MNPKIKITVDAKNKAIAAFEGMATVGAKIDVEITGLPSGIEDWGADDDFVGKSVRFRVVDELGHDLVRFPVVKKTTATDGDQWQVVSATSTTPETYKTYNGTTYAQVDFDTDKLRKAFCGVAFNDKLEFGVIIDSIVDAAEFAVGKMKIQQWAVASTEDPTVLPDWRNVVKTVLDAKDEAVEAAGTATTQAGIATTKAGEADASKQAAAASATSAGTSESNALSYKTAAETAKTNAEAAQASAETAKTNAETAQAAAEAAAVVAKNTSPYVGDNGNWFEYDSDTSAYVDTGIHAKGDTGAPGPQGAQGFPGPISQVKDSSNNWHNVYARTNSAGQFVLSLEQATAAEAAAEFVTLAGNQTITGRKTMTAPFMTPNAGGVNLFLRGSNNRSDNTSRTIGGFQLTDQNNKIIEMLSVNSTAGNETPTLKSTRIIYRPKENEEPVQIEEISVSAIGGVSRVFKSNITSDNDSVIKGKGFAKTSLPSSSFSEAETFPQSGGTYTVIKNGYVYLAMNGMPDTGWAYLYNQTRSYRALSLSRNNYCTIIVPVQEGDVIQVGYSDTVQTPVLRNIYANAEV